ncbi:hypothetical protein GGI11_003602 [Coemansia sp. RSA 2049]|nr:hypothetical protein GGI11_003602 [Coemansia sp. RSA 2049]KAJ2516169.1 hypothetical protein H4217_004747 [Coemansia sp. RSA 1939]KAJ2602210.1 hypothetical protein EV177_006848 [Coemansia sp. RSA 1804]
MSYFKRMLADRKQIILGTILTPLGIYAGITLKEWRDQREATRIEREVKQSASVAAVQEPDDSPSAIHAELNELRNAASALRTREGQLNMELESIDLKLSRVEAKIDKEKKKRD